MPQDHSTGAEANEYGHLMARRLATILNATSVSDSSSEFSLEGRLITIRCARKGTTQVGVTYKMLDRADAVYAAFENKDGIYEVSEMTPALYRLFMRDSKNEGKVGLVTRKQFREHGKHVSSIHA